MRAAVLACAAAPVLAACGALAPGPAFDAREVARSLYCNTPGATPQAALLADAQAVTDWQSARGIVLAPAGSLAAAPHAIVEMGMRSTGGYSVSVTAAALRERTVVLTAAFAAPAPGSLRTQALSSPCVLVQLPPGSYEGVEVRDAAGTVHARSGSTPAAAGTPDR